MCRIMLLRYVRVCVCVFVYIETPLICLNRILRICFFVSKWRETNQNNLELFYWGNFSFFRHETHEERWLFKREKKMEMSTSFTYFHCHTFSIGNFMAIFNSFSQIRAILSWFICLLASITICLDYFAGAENWERKNFFLILFSIDFY